MTKRFKNILNMVSMIPRVYWLGVAGTIGVVVLAFMFSENKAPADDNEKHGDDHTEHVEETLTANDLGIDESNLVTIGSGNIKSYLAIIGKIELDPNKANHLNPRYPGIVRSVFKSVGDIVKSGTRLATVESNVGLQTYHIVSSVAGTVLTRDISIGEYVNEDTEAFSVANTDVLWVHLTVRPADLSLVKVGDEVLVTSRDGLQVARGNLFYVSPLVDDVTRTAQATLKIDNKDGSWRPGMFIDGHLKVGSRKAEVIAPKKSIFRRNKEPFVLVKDGDSFELQEVDLGDNDFDSIEITGGVEADEAVVANISTEIEEKLNHFLDNETEEHGEDSHDHN